MVDVRRQANEVCTVRADQLIPEVDKQVVPRKAFGGLLKIRYKAADVAVVPPAFDGELFPEAVFSKAEQLVLR